MKNCVITAVGKSSLHRLWTNGDCHFDLHLIVYDDSYEEFIDDAPFVSHIKGYKLRVVYQYLQSNPKLLDSYEYFFIPDDDILMDSSQINSLFEQMRLYGLKIAQPALVDSYYLWVHTLRDPYCKIRYTNFVEMMVPCFSRKALRKVLFTFNENETGWGTETHWPLLIDAKDTDMAIVDAIPVVHTRPIQSGQTMHRKEAAAYLRKYQLVTQVKELGCVPVEESGHFLCDREIFSKMVGLLKRQLGKVFRSDSMGMNGYAGYIFLIFVLGRITQSRQYIDMAMAIFAQTPDCWNALKNSKIALEFKKMSFLGNEDNIPNSSDWKMLEKTFKQYHPLLFDKWKVSQLSEQEVRVCMLTYLDIENRKIAALIQTSASVVSNAKKKANRKIYGSDDASSLYQNMQKE